MPTLKETPTDAVLSSHQLMLRAGLIHQTTAGIYSWLPLGVRVLNNILRIIKEEQDVAGFQQIIMPTIQPANLWKESQRYDDYGKEMLRIKDRHDREMLYGPTAEEMVTDIGRQYLRSYKQFPLVLYQMHWKFRDEIRPRFGVMRGREFLMKDGYSFDMTQNNAEKTYERIFDSYLKIFDRIFKSCIKSAYSGYPTRVIPVQAEPGPIGGTLSHEFHIVVPNGESKIYFDPAYFEAEKMNYQTYQKIYAATEEMHDPIKGQGRSLKEMRGIELGHIFYFGDKYSKAMNFSVAGPDGKAIHPLMGSYGIGISRLVAGIIEACHDEKGIIWPKSITPFDIGIVNLTSDESHAEKLYQELQNRSITVLYDDRTNVSPGVKFADMDLIGLPYLIIIGRKFVSEGLLEVKSRNDSRVFHFSLKDFELFLDRTYS